VLNAWLRHNRQQYHVFVRLIDFLLGQGFDPVPTPPTRDAEYRQDHTRAMLDILSSFRDWDSRRPLKVFSTGPLYQPRTSQWTEAIDVEILDGNEPDGDAQALELIGTIMPTLADEIPQDELFLVVGHVGWLRTVLSRLGMPVDAQQEVHTAFQQGDLVSADHWLSRYDARVRSLLVPKAAQEFFPDLEEWIPGITGAQPHWAVPDHWTIRWDLSLTGSWPYYTGLVFSLGHPEIGHPLLNGGRFSLTQGRHSWHGVGFTLYPDPMHRYLGMLDGGQY